MNAWFGFPFFFFLLPTLLAAGTNRWVYHDGGSEETGSAVKRFECSVKKDGTNATLVMVSSWTTGVTVEIRGSATSADIKSVTGSDGSLAEQISFKFEDSFGNLGVGKLTSRLTSADLELTVTGAHADVERSRVTRQYRDIPFHLEPAS